MLSHYRIVEKIGEGGMGVVYRARDQTLRRDVALKVLPADRVGDAQRRLRFLREARAAAAVTHPNIATVHEIDEAEGVLFIAMELVEGETLRSRLKGRPLLVPDALGIATEIAEGLTRAHQSHVVHRDLKPENVVIGVDGHVKILDFGLAKILQHPDEAHRSQLSQAETASLELTEARSLLGTAAYMSPEQTRGETVDARSDIFSFGTTLYEMVTGKLPFSGKTHMDKLTAILHTQPGPASQINSKVPLELDRILAKCLEKDPRERYQSTEDLAVDLKRLGRDVESGSAPSYASLVELQRPPRSSRAARWIWPTVGLSVLVLTMAAWLFVGRSQPSSPLPRTVPLTSLPGVEGDPALSPDGNQVAYTWDGGGERTSTQLYVRLIDGGDPLQLTRGPDDVATPAWSPDGRRIAFLRHRADGGHEVFMIPALGGAERRLGYSLSAHWGAEGLSWSPDGKFLALAHRSTAEEPDGIFLLSTETGEKQRLTTAPPHTTPDWGDAHPVFSPDGETLAFLRKRDFVGEAILLKPVSGGEPTRLIYGTISGLDWTSNGRSLVFSASVGGVRGLWSIPRRGGEPTKLPYGERARELSIARGGDRLAFSQRASDYNIWRVNGPNSKEPPTTARFIASTRGDFEPQYSPDGSEVALSSTRTGQKEVYVCQSDGTECKQLTFDSGWNPRWSPDGRQIVFVCGAAKGDPNICIISSDGGLPKQVTQPAAAWLPTWSHDARWIYFLSIKGRDTALWRLPAEGGTAEQVTRNGGIRAQASADGRFVYYSKHSMPRTSPIWRAPVGGGEGKVVLDRRPDFMNWDLWGESIVYVNPDDEKGPTIELFDLTDRLVTEIAALGPRTRVGPGLSVSPDGRWILYVQIDMSSSDIMLVENFRQNP